MRGINCQIFFFQEDQLYKHNNTSCWAGVHSLLSRIIYINGYKEPETKPYREVLIATINEITPCLETHIENRQYTYHNRQDTLTADVIQFKTLSYYSQSLVLLNFIRNLWHEPINNYTKKFFTALLEAKHKDPLERLTWANKVACVGWKSPYVTVGHSNVFKGLVIKTTKQLFDFQDTEGSSWRLDSLGSIGKFLCE